MGHDPYQALYLHIPFCVKRCKYCDFTTEACDALDPRVGSYLDNLCSELHSWAVAGELAHIKTVYIGGGTPSHVGIRNLSGLFYLISTSIPYISDVEWSMEGNPESISEGLIKDIWALGVNRLSIGVQSFDDKVLATLGRAHNADRAREAIQIAQTRFENISIDLMCGIPGQSDESFKASLDEAICLGVRHVSIYPLTIEEHTPFFKELLAGTLPPLDEDAQSRQMIIARDVLQEAGFERYEVASYAKPGFQCAHNIAYWTGVPYLGIGQSAASMTQNESRRMRKQDGFVTDDLNAAQMVAEDLMLGMRMTRGVALEQIEDAKTLIPQVEECFEELCTLGLAELSEGRYRPTERGWLCGNELYGRIFDLA